MKKSKNYEMNLFDIDDFYTEEQLNENTEKTDEVLKSLENPEYEEAIELTELTSGEKLPTAFGKLAKAVKSFKNRLAGTSNIQKMRVTTAGWYRIAYKDGGSCYSGMLTMCRSWGSTLPENYIVAVGQVGTSFSFTQLHGSGDQIISKIRVVFAETEPYTKKMFLEVYAKLDASNTLQVQFTDQKFGKEVFCTEDGLVEPVTGGIPEGYKAVEYALTTTNQIKTDSMDVVKNILVGGNITAANFKGISKNFTTEDMDMAAAAPLVKQLYEENLELKENVKNIGKVSLKGRNGSGSIALSSNNGTIAMIYVARYGSSGEILDTNIFMAYRTYRGWNISDIFANGGVTCSFDGDTIKIEFNSTSLYGDIKILELG